MNFNKIIFKNKHSIAGVYFVSMVAITIISLLIIGYFWIRNEYLRFNEDKLKLRKNYIDTKKLIVREKMADILDFIDYKKKMANDEFRKRIKERVYIADSIMWNIYRKAKGKVSEDKLKMMISESLRPIRYDHGTGYHFIADLKGTDILYPVAPQYEGKNVLNLKDEKGNYVIRDEINLIKKQKEGFVTGYWRKPGSGDKMVYPKISYIKYFEPFDWYHGYGNYFDDIEKELQKEIVNRIKGLKISDENQIFILDYAGNFIFSPTRKYNGKNLNQIENKELREIYRKLFNLGKSKKGEFFEFSVVENSQEIPTLAYVVSYPDWNWMLGTEVHLNKVENLYKVQYGILKKNIGVYIQKITGLFLLITLFIFISASLISSRARQSFTTFSQFFKEAASKASKIDKNKLHFVEFKNLAIPANQMVEARAQIEKKLLESRENYRSLQENVPVGIFRVDSEGKFISVNKYMVNMLGFDKEADLLKASFESFFFNKDERKHLLRKLRNEKVITDYIIKLKKKDNSVFWASLNLKIVYDKHGKHVYHDGIISDVSQRIISENRIKYLNASLHAIRNVDKLITRAKDKKSLIRKACKTLINNQAYKRAWIILFDEEGKKIKDMASAGLTKQFMELESYWKNGKQTKCVEKALNQKKPLIIPNPKKNKECATCSFNYTSNEMGIYLVSLRFGKQLYGIIGVTVPMNLIYDEENLSLFEEIAEDLAFALHKIDLEIAHEESQKTVMKSLNEKKILLQEIHHRVKNNLQVITSLLRLQSDYIKDPDDKKMFEESTNRVKSMALIHEKLYQSQDFEKIDFGEYVRSLTRNLILSYGVRPDKVKLQMNIDDIILNIGYAIPLGLIINELFSNSLKYAFPNDKSGKIIVNLQKENDEFVLKVSDDGVGFPPNFDMENSNTLGMELIHTLSRQIKATMEFIGENGSTFIFRFKPKHI